MNSYATDGKCHNANRGTFNHECGKPATWIGEKPSGFKSGFCDHCREHGDKSRGFNVWYRANKSATYATLEQARAVANKIFEETGIVVAITAE